MKKNSTFVIDIDENELNQIDNLYNSNIEVFVTFPNGFIATIIVRTPRNLQYQMKKDKVNFYGPGVPWVFVQKLTKEIIEKAIEAHIAYQPDAYWLQLYHFTTNIDISVFNKLQTQRMKELKEIYETEEFD